jgi:Rrf2 family protein
MLKINKKVEYSLMVLKHLTDSDKGSHITAREICDKYSTPFDTTSKVMQVMSQKGILTSIQGQKGGYKLSTDLNHVSYLELVEIIEGKKINKDCLSSNCSLIDSCNITGPVEKLNQYLLYFFRGLSLHELLEEFNPTKQLLINLKGK